MKFVLIFFSFLYLLANENITIQLNWKYQFEFAGFIMAKEKGFYKKEGLNVDLRELTSTTNVLQYVLNHKNTYGVGDSSLINDALHNKAIKLLMPIYENSLYALVAVRLPDVQTLQDIVDYNITLDQFAIKNPAILAMLKSQNIDFSKLNVKKENYFNDINKKGIFGIYESNKVYELNKDNIPYTLFKPSDYGFNLYGDILFTSQEEYKSHPNRVKKVIKATIKGYIYAFHHINETINIILKKYNTQNLTKEKLLFEANILKKYLSKDFVFDMNKLENIKNIYILVNGVNSTNLEEGVQNLRNTIYHILEFTDKEKEFIKTHLIRGISTYSWEPFNLMKDGELQGIAIDYWKYIKKEANLKTTCFVVDNWSDVLKNIKEKKEDITCSTTKTANREKYALFSKPYVSFPIVIATRNDVGFINNIRLIQDKIIAVGKNYTAEKLLKKHYPNLKLLEVKNTNEALKLVSEGKVFAAVDILPVIAYKINKYNFVNLKISGKTPWTFNVRFMIRKDYPELVSIINKVIDSMPKYKKEQIYRKWVSVYEQQGYSKDYVRKIIMIVTGIVTIFVTIILYLVINLLKKKKVAKELHNLATMDKLTSIFNRYKIDMALNEQIEISKRYNRDMSVIFFDIDHFKAVNDVYGHKVGDFVLIELAKVINENIRSSDIFGRWGGEEFLIILPETDIETAYKLAEKLRTVIENHEFKYVPHIHISMGVTQLRSDDTLISLITRVDKLLYKSKRNGRNKVSFG